MTDTPREVVDSVSRGERSIFSLLPDYKRYLVVRQLVDDYLRDVFRKHTGIIDTAVARDRKGTNILNDFLHDNPRFKKFNVVTDNRISATIVKDQTVLVFDDSIHTGNSIVKTLEKVMIHKPKDVMVLCLLINKPARKKILGARPGTKIMSFRPPFPSYKQQRIYLLTELIGYLDGIRVKINPDFPSLTMFLACNDIMRVQDTLARTIEDKLDVQESYVIDSIADKRDSVSIGFCLNPATVPELVPQSKYYEADEAKVRCIIAKNGEDCEVVVFPILVPLFNIDECRVDSTNPDFCFYKHVKNGRRGDRICGFCLPFSVNQSFLGFFEENLTENLRKQGILVKSAKTDFPSVARYGPR